MPLHRSTSLMFATALLTLSCRDSSTDSAPRDQTQQRDEAKPAAPSGPAQGPATAKRGPKRVLRIAGYEFDPVDGLPQLPDRLGAVSGDAYHVVQLFDAPDRKTRARLTGEHGLSLRDYIPQQGYLERLDGAALERLRGLREVRAIVPYAPAFKVSPNIGKVTFRTDERKAKAGVWLLATLHRGQDAEAVANEIRAAGATEVEPRGAKTRGPDVPGLVRFVLAGPDEIPNVARILGVKSIEEVAEQIEDNGTTTGTIQSGTPGTTPLWAQGLNGEGQIVSVNDSGPVDINHCMFSDPANANAGPAHRKLVELRDTGGASTHATFVGGIVAGDDFNNPGTGANRGIAWAARIVSTDRSDDDTLTMLNLNRDSGATIHTNSWHDNTGNPSTYNQTAFDVDTFMWNNEDHLVLGSMGNVGEEQGPPGTAKGAIGVQASARDPNEGNFGDGNAGPTADGRRKPDLTTPGCTITSAQVNTACTITTGEVIYAVPPARRPQCATSWATPAAAGAAVLVRQYFMDGYYPSGTRTPHHAFTPSGALIKATLLNGTIDMAGPAGYPSTTEGWGMLRLDDSVVFPAGTRNLRVWDLRNATGIAAGETRDYSIEVVDPGESLNVTLVWTDPPPASATAAAPVVNDLDLTVISPGGASTFLGNVFATNQSATGGAADALNNVEQVRVNAPVAGMWTLRVTGSTVNVGDPFQGYALVASADMPEPPPPTGTQDTLVVRVRFPDADLAGIDPPLPTVQNTMTDVATYVAAASYGNASVAADHHPTVFDLDHQSDQYFPPNANPLVELAEEVLAELLAEDAAVFTRDPADDTDDVERIVIVTNDPDFNGDWATTGSWPYDVPGIGAPLSVSIQSYENSVARFSHGMLHQLELIDLYAHEGVVFAFPHANGWDNMAKPFSGQHSLLWNKQRPGWVGTGAPDVQWIARPAAGGSYGGLNPIPIWDQGPVDGNRKGIMIGLTEGAATPASETIFYYVEARSTADPLDANAPDSGVLIYYVNENVAQGEGPVWLLDAEPGTDTLADAAFQVGESRSIPGTGITLEVLAGSAGAAYDIQVTYEPPDTDNDVNIVKGDTIDGTFRSYMSPDIWVDNGRNGFDEDGGGAPNPSNADQPIEGELNRLYFRLHNPGPAVAYDVDVHVRMSEPYHTVGGSADFNRFVGQVRIDSIAAGGADPIRFVEWTPDEDGNPHSCAWVETLAVFNDVNTLNNEAQENLREVTSSTSSPYEEVRYPVSFSNPYDEAHLFYFRAQGVPDDWTRTLSPRKALLAPGERIEVELTVKPPDDAPVCTDHRIDVTSWVSRGDTLVQVGGGSQQVGLRAGTEIRTEVEQRPCGKQDPKQLTHQRARDDAQAGQAFATQGLSRLYAFVGALTAQQQRNCQYIIQKGCTDPKRPFEEIIVRYEDPAGNPVYHSVMTDENGCFEDFYVAAEGGVWTASAEYPGSDCSGPAVDEPVEVHVNVAIDHDQDDDGRPDGDEHPADADGDGLVGPMDTDSDNDGVPDGDEPDGDHDGDGFINVIDPDSDGDGILDGQDATPWGEVQPPARPTCKSLCDRDRRLVILVALFGLLLLFMIFVALWRRRA